MINYKDEFISSKKKKMKPKPDTLQRDRKCKVNKAIKRPCTYTSQLMSEKMKYM